MDKKTETEADPTKKQVAAARKRAREVLKETIMTKINEDFPEGTAESKAYLCGLMYHEYKGLAKLEK